MPGLPGLGTLNDNLPGFVVLPRTSYPQGGASNWSNGYLPADHQGTPLRPEGSPILDLHAPAGMTRKDQRNNLDLLAKLNRKHFKARSDQGELDARMSSYELAYRMQMEVPGILDLKGETVKTKEAYGIGDSKTDSFGRKCLLARRLVEKGFALSRPMPGIGTVTIILSGLTAHSSAPSTSPSPLCSATSRNAVCSKTPWWFGAVSSVVPLTMESGAEAPAMDETIMPRP